MNPDTLIWSYLNFDQLSCHQLYEILKARQCVFQDEQDIRYVDCDDKDYDAIHVCGWLENQLVAYLRILPPGTKSPHHSIGRVLTSNRYRGQGYGKKLMTFTLEQFYHREGILPIGMSAQAYLEKFYQDFGFVTNSSPYLEEGISHIAMVKLR